MTNKRSSRLHTTAAPEVRIVQNSTSPLAASYLEAMSDGVTTAGQISVLLDAAKMARDVVASQAPLATSMDDAIAAIAWGAQVRFADTLIGLLEARQADLTAKENAHVFQRP